jgi:hypothetical protein
LLYLLLAYFLLYPAIASMLSTPSIAAALSFLFFLSLFLLTLHAGKWDSVTLPRPYMNYQEFKHNLTGGEQLMLLSDPDGQEYWAGYLRGMRRCYHGENFGTEAEHGLWMSLADEADRLRRYRGLGYRAGAGGMPIAEAIRHLAKYLAASAAGSVRS